MPLPRNLKARNHNSIKKNKNKSLIQKKNEIKQICEKHGVGKLTFRSCKLATFDGQVTFVEHNEIDGNLKMGIFIIKASSLLPSGNNKIYDIIEIEKNKLERDIKKKKEEEEKSKEELDRIKKNEEANKEHEKITKELSEVPTNSEEIVNISQSETSTNDIIDIKNSDEIINETQSEILIDTDIKNNEKKEVTDKVPLELKKDKKNNQHKEQLHEAPKVKEGNKYFRRFMQDVRSSFNLTENKEYRFIEFKAETTDMVIENVKIYEISMPIGIKETYFLVIGDLQMKSGLIKQKDPSYEFEDVLADQYEFLERIKSKENSKTIELSDEIDDDLDSADEEKSRTIELPKEIDEEKTMEISKKINNDLDLENTTNEQNVSEIIAEFESSNTNDEMIVGDKKIADYLSDAMKLAHERIKEQKNRECHLVDEYDSFKKEN